MSDDLSEILIEFIAEARDGLDEVEEHLLALETAPEDEERLSAVFRTVHSIKGTAAMFGLLRIEEVGHAGETLMDQVRQGHLSFQPDHITALLRALDTLRTIMGAVETEGSEPEGHDEELVDLLLALSRGESASVEVPSVEPEPDEEDVDDEPSVVQAPRKAAKAESKDEPKERKRPVESHVRVDVRLLDELMNLVGELVLVRNRMLQTVSDPSLAQSTQQLDLITTELQEGVMKTRMQTVGTVLSRIPRVVRDLAMQVGKDIRVEISGQETELDRTVIEAIKDPLTHLVRNAVDHGVESPEKRRAAGKPAQGVLSLSAYHEGGQVCIELADDGAGINVDRVCDRALERSIVTQGQLMRMSQREIWELIFQPGFSTAASVTTISGRGVGMDVVRTHIEQIGGSVEVNSAPGQGTTFLLRIPLTLAIISTLLVTSHGVRYAIPQVNLVELVRIDPEVHLGHLAEILSSRLLRLRGQLLPLVELSDVLSREGHRDKDAPINVAVLQAGRTRFGLIVDEINDTEEIVVKPLGKLLKGLSPYAGATILGDGSVALILDIPDLARTAELSESQEEPQEEAAAEEQAQGEHMQLLTFAAGSGTRMALPLGDVARLEEVEKSRIEWTAGRPVIQYRNDLLPIVYLRESMGLPPAESEREQLDVLVCRTSQGHLGVVVDRVLDIVEQHVAVLRRNPAAPPILSRTAVLEGQVTDLLDIEALVQTESIPLLASA